MGRQAPDRAESLPRVLAGLLVPVVGIALLTFYLSDRPAEAAMTLLGTVIILLQHMQHMLRKPGYETILL